MLVGAVHERVTWPLATTGAATVGEPATVRGTKVTAGAAVSPSTFFAATVKL